MATDWQMPRRGESCSLCGKAFDFGATFLAQLFEDNTGYSRRDICLDCPPPELPLALASWRTRRPRPAARKAYAFDREAVLGFFLRMADPDSQQKVQLRFVLALLLWRKKVLKFEGSDTVDECERWRFTLPAGGEKFAVQRPDLDEEEIESLSMQLESLLASETTGADEIALTDATEPTNA